MAHEGTAQRIGIGKAALSGDLLGGFVSLFEKAAGGIDPRLLDQVAGVMPTSLRKSREKWRGLRSIRLARLATL